MLCIASLLTVAAAEFYATPRGLIDEALKRWGSPLYRKVRRASKVLTHSG